MANKSSHPKTTRIWAFESSIGLTILSVIIVIPVGWIVLYSVLYSLGMVGRLSTGWTLSHWAAAFERDRVGMSFAYSATVASIVVGLATVLALGLTMMLHPFRRDRRVLVALSVPMATPVAVIAVMVYQLLNPGGFFARLAFHVGMIRTPTEFPVLVNDAGSFGIIIAGLFGTVPLLTMCFLNAWSSAKIDRYLMLGASLGATSLRSRLGIVVPMLLKRGRSIMLLIFLMQLGSYEVPLLLGRQSPQMISVLTQRRFGQFDLSQRPRAFVIATAYLILVGLGVNALQQMRRRHEE